MSSPLAADSQAPVAALARDTALAATPVAERRVALLLDRPAAADAAVVVLAALKQTGYRVTDMPSNAAALTRQLDAGAESLMCNDYAAYFAGLPRATQQRVTARWGAPERDPAFRPGRVDCGCLALATVRFGNVAVAMTGAPEEAPPHRALALRAWLEDGFRAQAILPVEAPAGRA